MTPDTGAAPVHIPAPLLEVENLHIGFRSPGGGNTPIVHGVSFCLNRNESVAVVGESGCGKSVTALALGRLLPQPPTCKVSGSVRFEGKDVYAMTSQQVRDYRRRSIAYVFQDPASALNPVLTIGYQLNEVLDGTRGQKHQQARDVLALAGLPDPARCLKAYPHALSGGMQQRVVIAMALARQPALLIADEPTTALDVTIQAQILDVLTRAQQKLGMALLLITHNLGLVAGAADHVWVMYAGHLVEKGPVDSVLRMPAHPYTNGLLHVVPRLQAPAGLLEGIPGTVPEPGQMLPGCPFAPRCTRASATCRDVTPTLAAAERADAARQVACHHPLPTERQGDAT